MSNALSCAMCDRRLRQCDGQAPCTVDNKSIIAHIGANYCPHPVVRRFGDGVKPDGWDALPDGKCNFVRPKLPVASDEEIAELFERDKLGGCGCKE